MQEEYCWLLYYYFSLMRLLLQKRKLCSCLMSDQKFGRARILLCL